MNKKKEKKVRTRSTYYSALSQKKKKYYSALIWILEHNYGILQILNRDRELGMGFFYIYNFMHMTLYFIILGALQH